MAYWFLYMLWPFPVQSSYSFDEVGTEIWHRYFQKPNPINWEVVCSKFDVRTTTLGPAYNEHFDAKEFTHCKWVLVVTELALTRILLVVQSSYQCIILSYLMSTNH